VGVHVAQKVRPHRPAQGKEKRRKRRQVPLENRKSRLRQACPANADGWNGLPVQTSLSSKRDGGMENFLLFILSSSVCALVASVTLLLRPLVGLP
jgi:hypothetical protein